jgi:hypothetical protein
MPKRKKIRLKRIIQNLMGGIIILDRVARNVSLEGDI